MLRHAIGASSLDGQSSESSLYVPLDILHTIANILAEEDDLATLGSLALTQRDLCAVCQSHIFSTIDLAYPTAQQYLGFIDALTSNPSLSRHTRKLNLYLPLKVVDNPEVAARLPWALEQLSDVTSLDLRSSELSWPNIEVRLRTTLENFIQSPKLIELYIGLFACVPIVKLVILASNLRHLYLGRLRGPNLDFPSTTISGITSASQLESLKIFEDQCNLVRSLLQAKMSNGNAHCDFRRLTRVSMRLLSNAACKQVQEICSIMPSLRHLKLEGKFTIQIFYSLTISSTSVGSIASLSDLFMGPGSSAFKGVLTLSLVLVPFWPNGDPLCGFTDGLVFYPAGNELEEVEIYVTVSNIKEEHWRPLDESLSNRNVFSCLAKVRIIVGLENWNGDDLSKKPTLDLAERYFRNLRRVCGEGLSILVSFGADGP